MDYSNCSSVGGSFTDLDGSGRVGDTVTQLLDVETGKVVTLGKQTTGGNANPVGPGFHSSGRCIVEGSENCTATSCPTGSYCDLNRTTPICVLRSPGTCRTSAAGDCPPNALCDESMPTTIAPGDIDFDTVPDTVDNCQFIPNADQADGDDDGVGDFCDLSGVGTTSHFQCYEIKPAAMSLTSVTVEDQFDTEQVTLRFPHRLCAPASKGDELALDEDQHLTGYTTMRTPFARRRNQTIVNQLGVVVLDVTRRDVLMVPTAKSLTQTPTPLPPPTIDHFQCYRVKRSRGQPRFAKLDVTVGSQFETLTETLLRPLTLCVPANKGGEDPGAPSHPGALLCYKSRASANFGTIEANIANQFGTDHVTLIHRRELCVPSFIVP
jgi:hypothetical protein